MGPISFFHTWKSKYHNTIYWRDHLLHWVFLVPLSNISWSNMPEFTSGLSILFHWSTCWFLFYQCHAVLMTITLQYNLESERIMWDHPPAFSFSIFLWLFEVFCGSIWISEIFSSFIKYVTGISIWNALNLWIAFSNINIITVLILTIHKHEVLLHLFVFFHFFHPCHVVYSIEIFHFLS